MSGRALNASDLSPFGAEVDIDLSAPLDEPQKDAIRDLLNARGILLFRGQTLADADQSRVMGLFGNVLVEEGGHREISRDGNLGCGQLLFHSDLAFTPEPFKLLSLYALEVSEGTETMFASCERAVDSLPLDLRARIAQLRATNVIPPSQSERLVSHGSPTNVPQATRDLLVNHPVTGRSMLSISEQQTARIEDLAPEDSDALLADLFAALYSPGNVYRHLWRNGDLVVWDNRALQHARPDQSATPRRRMRRTAVADKTFFQLCPQFAPDDQRIAEWGVGGLLDLTGSESLETLASP